MKEKVFLGILLSFFLTGASFAGEPLVLNLQDSIERVLNYNLDVQIARIKVEKAKLELKKEKASFKPQANISAYPLQWKGEHSFLEYSPQAGFNASFSTLWGMNATLSVTQQKGEDDKIEGTLSFTITQKILPTPKLASPY
ncbi:TolC family protein, partial [Candidatus Aerophobetes bacterium]|nr:TolC family protein [Candidatus Aerophobetes bacterium]